mgnify:CR=1 FL=1
MQINLWDYKDYASIPEELKNHSLTFVDDSADGSIVECGFCKKEFTNIKQDVCPHCKNDIIYPRVDW